MLADNYLDSLQRMHSLLTATAIVLRSTEKRRILTRDENSILLLGNTLNVLLRVETAPAARKEDRGAFRRAGEEFLAACDLPPETLDREAAISWMIAHKDAIEQLESRIGEI